MTISVRKQEARRLARRAGIRLNLDYYQLRSSEVDKLSEIRKVIGYRAPAIRSGSATRYFYEYLQRGS